MDSRPIFITGLQRSGTTLLYALIGSHPKIALTRRTKFWEYFYNRFGDLNDSENFERCQAALKRYQWLAVLEPDWTSIREEFRKGVTTYARLYALLEEQYARRQGKTRWGDKSHDLEGHAQAIFDCYPKAKMIHIIRDPRDRYVSAHKANRVGRSGVAGGIAAWLWSADLAKRNLRRYPEGYKIVRFEEVVFRTEETLRDICNFIEEEYAPKMLSMQGAATFRDKGGNSSFQSHQSGSISRSPVGRFRQFLPQRELALMQAFAKHEMMDFDYQVEPVGFSGAELLRHHFVDRPVNWALVAQWQARNACKNWIRRTPSARRLSG